MDKRQRFSLVPWLRTESDLRPYGEPESTVEFPSTITLGLRIPSPFGRGTDTMLAITATRGNGNDGGIIAMAITDVIRVDTRVVETPPAPPILQRNPVRRVWPDDSNGANDPDGDD